MVPAYKQPTYHHAIEYAYLMQPCRKMSAPVKNLENMFLHQKSPQLARPGESPKQKKPSRRFRKGLFFMEPAKRLELLAC